MSLVNQFPHLLAQTILATFFFSAFVITFILFFSISSKAIKVQKPLLLM